MEGEKGRRQGVWCELCTKGLAPAPSQLHPLGVDPADHVEKIRHKAGDAALEQRGISRHHRLLRYRHPVG
jgi:hypothetical protein